MVGYDLTLKIYESTHHSQDKRQCFVYRLLNVFGRDTCDNPIITLVLLARNQNLYYCKMFSILNESFDFPQFVMIFYYNYSICLFLFLYNNLLIICCVNILLNWHRSQRTRESTVFYGRKPHVLEIRKIQYQPNSENV